MKIEDSQTQRSRRDFLKLMGFSAVSMAMSQTIDVAASEGVIGERFGWLIDITRCVNCGACSRACKESNNLPPVSTEPTDWTFDTWTYIDSAAVPISSGESPVYSVKRQCMHCLEPACASACPVGALHQTSEGAVIYDVDLCMGCRYCMLACPFDVPHFDWQSGLTPMIGKCTLCRDRREQGLAPACVEACPVGTLEFGTRERVLAIAKARIKDNPNRYFDKIYGEHEAGGTSVLYISPVPFEKLGFRTDIINEPLPPLTWNILKNVPIVAAGMALAMSGTTWFTGRQKE